MRASSILLSYSIGRACQLEYRACVGLHVRNASKRTPTCGAVGCGDRPCARCGGACGGLGEARVNTLRPASAASASWAQFPGFGQFAGHDAATASGTCAPVRGQAWSRRLGVTHRGVGGLATL